MKKLLTLSAIALAVVVSSCSKFDDSAIWDKLNEQEQTLNDHEKRIAALEELCKQMNSNISSLQTIITALQNNDYVTAVTPVTKDGKTIGYTITFTKSSPITIYHGENGKDGINGSNGKDGVDGYTPIIGVKQDTDGIYYWTIDGEWLMDDSGNKIKAIGTDGKNGTNGTDGKDGVDGENGANGSDGKDGVDGNNGITPQLKIENGYWYVSYDNGSTWVELGKATGDDGKDGQNGADGSNGKDGADGKNGDSFFKSVDTSDTNYVIFTLADGTIIKLPTWYAFEQLQVLCNQMNTNITSLQSIVNALQNHDYITSCTPLMENGVQIGYTISFAKTDSIVIYNGKNGSDGSDGEDGKDGADGKDGSTPIIGVKQDTDNIYYWTLNGEWLLDDNGNKIKAVGEDGSNGQDGTDGMNGSNGSNGQDGEDGTDGRDGVDGITPRLKIENDYWYVSYDEGATWTELGRATGEDGTDGSDGADGSDGDSIFSSVTQDDEYVYFNLADGTMITLPKHDKENIQFEDLQVKAICCKNWDTNNDGELSYAEAAAITDIGTVFMNNVRIISFTELKYFTGLTFVANSAFSGCSNLWKIVLPKNISKIESSAFADCNDLTIIMLPDNISSIGNRAFSSCSSLQNIEIPSNVTYIGQYAFEDCIKMRSIIIPDNVSIIDKGALNGCSFRQITIGNGVAEFGWGVFYDCVCDEFICYSSIRDASSDSSGSGVFYKSSFDKATFGGRCTKIGSYAFTQNISAGGSDYGKVKTIILEESVAIVGKESFNVNTLDYVYCKSILPPQGSTNMFYSNLEKIYVPLGCADSYKTAPYWKNYASKIEEYDFENNPI